MVSRARRTAIPAVAALALVGALLQAPPAFAATVGEQEPNGKSSTAQTIELGSTIAAGFRTTGDCDNNFYDCDYYKVTTPSAGRLTLDITFSDALGTEGKFDLAVLDAAGKTTHDTDVSVTDYSGARVKRLGIYVDAGVNYILLKARVSGFSSNYIWKGQPYNLTTAFRGGTVETEVNGKTATADVLALGATITGSTFSNDCNSTSRDCDNFRVVLPKASKVQVDFRFPCNLDTKKIYDVEVYDNSGRTIGDFNPTGADCKGSVVRGTVITAPAGNLYVMVAARNDGVAFGQSYTLAVTYALAATPKPKITGTAKVGKTLKVKPGTWKPGGVALSYQWLRNGAPIKGATATSYKLTKADKGKKITVAVTGKKAQYTTVTKTSSSTKKVK